jgi:hypothetical protein
MEAETDVPEHTCPPAGVSVAAITGAVTDQRAISTTEVLVHPLLTSQFPRHPLMMTSVAVAVLIICPDVYVFHDPPLLIEYSMTSLHPTPPLPELMVALTNVPAQTDDIFGDLMFNDGATNPAETFHVVVFQMLLQNVPEAAFLVLIWIILVPTVVALMVEPGVYVAQLPPPLMLYWYSFTSDPKELVPPEKVAEIVAPTHTVEPPTGVPLMV